MSAQTKLPPAIREMQLADIPAVRALAQRVWRQCYPSIISEGQIAHMLDMMYSDAALTEQLTVKGHRFWLLFLEGKLAGYISAGAEKPGHWHIHKFYVDAARHRQGLGALLMKHIAAELQPREFTLGVNRANVPAINFYFRNGFTISHCRDTDIGGGYRMEDFMMKRIF